MPHDRNGSELKVGDKVTLAGTVTQVMESEACNIVLQFQHKKEGFSDTVTVSAFAVEKEHEPDTVGGAADE